MEYIQEGKTTLESKSLIYNIFPHQPVKFILKSDIDDFSMGNKTMVQECNGKYPDRYLEHFPSIKPENIHIFDDTKQNSFTRHLGIEMSPEESPGETNYNL